MELCQLIVHSLTWCNFIAPTLYLRVRGKPATNNRVLRAYSFADFVFAVDSGTPEAPEAVSGTL
jgi:hypothetical protein